MDNFQLSVVTALGYLKDQGSPPPYTSSQLVKALRETSNEPDWNISPKTLGKLVDTGFLKVSKTPEGFRIWPAEDFDNSEDSLSAFQIIEPYLPTESQSRHSEEHSSTNRDLAPPPISDQQRARSKTRMKERRDIMRNFISRHPEMFKP